MDRGGLGFWTFKDPFNLLLSFFFVSFWLKCYFVIFIFSFVLF